MTRLPQSGYFVFILIVVNQESNVAGYNLFQQSNFIEVGSVMKCVADFVKLDEFQEQTIVIIGNQNKSGTRDNVQETAKVLASEHIPQIIVEPERLEGIANRNRDNLILLAFTELNKISSLVNATVNKEFKCLIVVEEVLDEESYGHLETIGHTLQHDDATFVVKRLSSTNYTLVTTIPSVDGATCDYDDKVKLTVTNTCADGVLAQNLIFPSKKTTNLQNCPFNVGMATMYPYSMINDKETLENLQPINESQIRGSDLEMIKVISNYFNATLRLYYIYREEENPFLHLEYIPFLLNGTVDACAGGLYRIYGDVVHYSGVYTRQAVLWVYSAERDPLSWQTVIAKINGLYVFILFYLCYCVVWIACCNVDNVRVSYRNTFLNGWGALMGTSSLQDSNTWKQKILNISYLILCLHLSAYISIQLYSFFTIRGPPALLRTNDDVMESGRTAYLKLESKFFVDDAKYVAFANKSQNCANFQDCETKTVAFNGLTVIPEGYFHWLQAATAVEHEARVLKPAENIITMYHEMIVRKDSPFAATFGKIVQRLFEAGICDRLYLEAIGLLIEAKARNANSNIIANSYACESGCAITVAQIAGAIYVWALGCFVSLFLFLIEVTINKN